MAETESRSSWVFGLSLVQVILLLFFGAMIFYVTEHVEVRGQESRQEGGAEIQDAGVQVRLNAESQKNVELQKQLGEMITLVDELKLMVGAKVLSKEGFQEAIDNLKRGYALCQKDDNTLIEARIENGEETLRVIGEIPSDLTVSLAKGDQTSDLEEMISFIQDVYEYEKDRRCRFNYRLKYVTDNDYRKGRDSYEKHFYPEKILRAG